MQRFEVCALVRLAREALAEEGHGGDSCALAISRVPRKKVIRIAFDSPHTYGRRGACWYDEHHAFARLLSAQFDARVHAYVLDPEEFEKVTTYAAGRPVGGETLRYDEVDPPTDAVDENAFEEIKSRWPLGYLARILGVTRSELIRLPRAPSVLLDLGGAAPQGELTDILPPPAW